MKIAWMTVGLMLVGCGVSQSEVIESSDTVGVDGTELSASSRTYVTLTRDMRRCLSPVCGGYFVTDVNRVSPAPRYVSGLTFAGSGLDEETINKALEAVGGELVLRGKLGAEEKMFHTRPFLVSGAWRGLPGMKVAAGDAFDSVEPLDVQCFAAPCPTGRATRLNAGGTTTFHEIDLDSAALVRVDRAWLLSRINLHDAIVAAHFVTRPGGPGGVARVLTASQVFVKLPEAPGPCPLVKMPPCAAGTVRSFNRNVDRCELPSACVIPGVCAQYQPNCEAGYTLQSWSGGSHACQVFACDPAFSL